MKKLSSINNGCKSCKNNSQVDLSHKCDIHVCITSINQTISCGDDIKPHDISEGQLASGTVDIPRYLNKNVG